MIVGWSRKFSGGGGSPPISSNLELWLDANQIVGLVDNDPVTTWADMSGHSRDFAQAGGPRPTYKTTSVTINSLPVVQFSASVPEFVSRAGFDTTGWAGASIYFVGRINTDPPGAANESGLWNFGRGAAELNTHFPFTDGSIYDGTLTDNRQTVGNPTPALTTAFQITILNGETSVKYTYRVNKADVFTTDASSFLGYTGTDDWKIGQSISSLYNYDGVMGEILVYSVKHSSTDRDTVEGALSTKWGL